MTEPAREIQRIEASRIVSVTYKAKCPFCGKLNSDCDGAAVGCCHVKELQIGGEGQSHFIFERA